MKSQNVKNANQLAHLAFISCCFQTLVHAPGDLSLKLQQNLHTFHRVIHSFETKRKTGKQN